MIPSDQGLRPDELTGPHVDYGLVVQHELGFIDGSTQFRFELEPGLNRFLHRRLEDHDPVPAAIPRDRSGRFRPSQQAARIGFGRRGRRDAHADGQVEWVLGDLDGHAQRSEDAMRRREPILRRRVTVEQNPKLVPAQAATGVGRSDRCLQPA